MLYLLIFILASLFLALCLPVYFVVSYNNGASAYFRFLFIKKKIPLDVEFKTNDFSAILDELTLAKDKVFDIYGKLNGKIKISRLKIDATVDMGDAFFFPLIWGAVNAAIGTFVGALDSQIGVKRNKADICVKCANLDTPLSIFGVIILKTSLFHLLFASTYTFIKAIFKGGKNGRKQAK